MAALDSRRAPNYPFLSVAGESAAIGYAAGFRFVLPIVHPDHSSTVAHGTKHGWRSRVIIQGNGEAYPLRVKGFRDTKSVIARLAAARSCEQLNAKHGTGVLLECGAHATAFRTRAGCPCRSAVTNI